MNIVKATHRYELWLGQHIALVKPHLRLKHRRMAESPFSFLRATFYRWMQVWPEVCRDLDEAPHVLAVGDLHLENFGTWRDVEGRLVWGVNDFDEAALLPYTLDLVRLATSAILASQEGHLSLKTKDACAAILEGYRNSLNTHGKPFVLEENNKWLRQIATSELRDPERFWQKMEVLPVVKGQLSASTVDALEHLLPEDGLDYRVVHRVAGLGSLGHVRLVALAECHGSKVAREAKALAPSSVYWARGTENPAEIMYQVIIKRAVRDPDPFVHVHGSWIVRRLSPHCSRIELSTLPKERDDLRLLFSMGWETANIHLGSAKAQKVVQRHINGMKRDWLVYAARNMADRLSKDWRTWREGNSS
jgi:Uncharacterized protein conserved in bacteria (DUF2252)